MNNLEKFDILLLMVFYLGWLMSSILFHRGMILQLRYYKFSFEDLIEDLSCISNPFQKDWGLSGLRILNHLRKDLDFWIFWIGLRIFSKL